MIRLQEIINGLKGMMAMVDGRADWRTQLDLSMDGVFRSFWALPLCIPLMIIQVLGLQNTAKTLPPEMLENFQTYDVPLSFFLILSLLSFLLSWLASLIAIVGVSRFMNKTSHASTVITGYNWAQLLSTFLLAAVSSIWLILPEFHVLMFATMVTLLFSLYLNWGVFRRGFEGDIPMTIAILLGVGFIGFLVNGLVTDICLVLYELLTGTKVV